MNILIYDRLDNYWEIFTDPVEFIRYGQEQFRINAEVGRLPQTVDEVKYYFSRKKQIYNVKKACKK